MELESSLDALGRKIVQKDELPSLCDDLRAKGLRIVSTNGTFDILHVGHVHSLITAKAQGDVLIVGVNSDDSVKRYKGPTRPIVPATERALMLAALECVDYVFIFDEDTPIPWIPLIKPHVHVKGSDRALADIVEKDIVEAHGGTIVQVAHSGHSSTALILRAKGPSA